MRSVGNPPEVQMPGMRLAGVALLAAIALGACSSGGATPSPAATAAAASAAPSAAASVAASAAAPAGSSAGSSAAASAAVNPDQMAPVTGLEMKTVGALGNVLVASNGYTVYTFTKDTKDSGKSACTGGCLAKWPAVTVAAGGTAAVGTGLTGTIGTITREDNGASQLTYNGLPIYFFIGDTKAGDGNGIYTNWEAVKP
jgi:predicted lipoprotein with Yx(FWY)xxD motif